MRCSRLPETAVKHQLGGAQAVLGRLHAAPARAQLLRPRPIKDARCVNPSATVRPGPRTPGGGGRGPRDLARVGVHGEGEPCALGFAQTPRRRGGPAGHRTGRGGAAVARHLAPCRWRGAANLGLFCCSMCCVSDSAKSKLVGAVCKLFLFLGPSPVLHGPHRDSEDFQ